MTKCKYNGKITTYNDISTTYDSKTTAYNDKRTAYNDKSTVYNIINSTYNERSTTSNKKALHIMGTALHVIKQIDIRQSWRSILLPSPLQSNVGIVGLLNWMNQHHIMLGVGRGRWTELS